MKVLAFGFAAYMTVLFAVSLLAIHLLRPLATELTPPVGARAADEGDWLGSLTGTLDAARARWLGPPSPPPRAAETMSDAPRIAAAAPTAPDSAAVLVPAESSGADGDAAPITAPVSHGSAGVPPAPSFGAGVEPSTVAASVIEPVVALAVQPPPDAAPAPPALPAIAPLAGEVTILRARGDGLLATGDLAAARLFYQRAAERGDGAACLGVAKTYDPLFLEQAGFRQVRGDEAAAAAWYRKAIAAGEPDAEPRLTRLLARTPAPTARP